MFVHEEDHLVGLLSQVRQHLASCLPHEPRTGRRLAGVHQRADFASGSGARAYFDEAVGYKAGELTHDEIDRLRPEVYVYESLVREEAFYCKVHDAFACLPDGRALFPPEATRSAVYLIRNPLDVCVSFAHHLAGPDLEEVIASMADPTFAFCDVTEGQLPQLRQGRRAGASTC